MNLIRITVFFFLAANILFGDMIFDEKIIRDAFQKKELSRLKTDRLPFFEMNSEIVKSKLSNLEKFEKALQLKVADIKELYSCPKGSIGYTTTLYDIDLTENKVTCMLSFKEEKEKPILLFNYKITNPAHKKYFSVDQKEIIKKNSATFNRMEKTFSTLEDAYRKKDDHSNVTMPHIVAASLINDGRVIDMKSSFVSNKLVLQDNLKMKATDYIKIETVQRTVASEINRNNITVEKSGGYFEYFKNYFKYKTAMVAQTFGIGYDPTIEHKISKMQIETEGLAALFTNRIVMINQFYLKYSKIIDIIISTFIAIAIAIGIFRYIGAKVAKGTGDEEAEKQASGGSRYWLSIFFVGILFWPQSVQKIKDGEEEYHQLESYYNQIERLGYYNAIDLANIVSDMIIDTELEGIASNAGFLSRDRLISAFSNKEVLSKQKKVYQDLYNICDQTYSRKVVFAYRDQQDTVFPVSEQWMIAKNIATNSRLDYYSHESGVVKKDLDGEYPSISISGCGRIYQKLKRTDSVINKMDDVIFSTKNKSDLEKIERLKTIIEASKQHQEQWGYLSLVSLPLTKIGAKLAFDTEEPITKQNDQTVMEDLSRDIPYMFVPGVSTVAQISLSNPIVGAALSLVGAGYYSLEDEDAENPVGASAALGGTGFAIWIVKIITASIPLLAVSILLILLFLHNFFKMWMYHTIAPFVVLFSFLQGVDKKVKHYLLTLASVWLEVVLLAFAAFGAFCVIDLFEIMIGGLSSSTQQVMAAGATTFVEKLTSNVIFGVMEIAGSFILTWVVYIVMTTFVKNSLAAFEMKVTDAMSDQNSKLSSKV